MLQNGPRRSQKMQLDPGTLGNGFSGRWSQCPKTTFVFPCSFFPQHLCFGSPFLRPCECHSRILEKWISPGASATRMGGCYCRPPLTNTFYTESQIPIPANLVLPSITFWSPADLIWPSITFWISANLILPRITFWSPASLILPSITFWSPANLICCSKLGK